MSRYRQLHIYIDNGELHDPALSTHAMFPILYNIGIPFPKVRARI
jgi:hypothetical protein